MIFPNPKVTVLISTYNRPQYLREAIASVVGQTMTDWELLIMNDGGEDVKEIVDEFNDSRINYFHDPVNRKLPYRLNFGLRRARGQYIAYLGDDDLYYPNHLAVLSETLDQHPEIGVAYSDLYAVQFIRDISTGKRYPVNKFIQVSRDFNRDFMFYFNHTLHVSIMHRRDLALAVGGYDESVRVLIDWNLTRKLSFATDFKYVPVPTGEYYMPIGQSDRISNLERKDNRSFTQNIRRIKADMPAKPWPKVDSVAVIFPVLHWGEENVQFIEALYDATHYPAEFILVNMDRRRSPAGCKKMLGVLGELKNIRIVQFKKGKNLLDAYRIGAQRTDAEFVYLPTENAETSNKLKLIAARRKVRQMNSRGVKWKIKEEMATPFDMLIERAHFLEVTHPTNQKKETEVSLIDSAFPSSLECDALYHQATQQLKEGKAEIAYVIFKHLEKHLKGAAGKPFQVDLYSKICFEIGKYQKAEEQCRMLIAEGYGADNWIRLGTILQAEKNFDEAIEAFRNGLEGIELSESDLDSPVFPIAVNLELGSFLAFMGIGECYLEKGMLTEAARMFRKSARLNASSYRPFLGFGRMFLVAGETEKATEALEAASVRSRSNAMPDLILGQIKEKSGSIAAAFLAYKTAFEKDNTNQEATQCFYEKGVALGETETLREAFEKALHNNSADLSVKKKLVLTYIKTGKFKAAESLVEACRKIAPNDPEVQSLHRLVSEATVAGPAFVSAANIAGDAERFSTGRCSGEGRGEIFSHLSSEIHSDPAAQARFGPN